MNKELLQHFLTLRPFEKDLLSIMNGDKSSALYIKVGRIEPDIYLTEGKQIALSQAMRFVHNSEHTHNFVEMIYAYHGQSTHIVNGNKVVLHPGELLVLNQRATHQNLILDEQDIVIHFIILPQFFETTLLMAGDTDNHIRKFLLDCLHNPNPKNGYLHFEVADVLPVQNLLENLIWSLLNKMQYKRSVNQFTMSLLFLHLLSHTGKAHLDSERDAQLFKILQYIDERYADGTLSELAKQLGYNMTWLSRHIKQITGSSFKQMQQAKRVSQAKFLLSTTRLPIIEIAKQLGFNDASHFYRLFQKQVGCSPKNFRNNNRN